MSCRRAIRSVRFSGSMRFFFNGYSESLNNYDFKSERFAIGVALNDLLIKNWDFAPMPAIGQDHVALAMPWVAVSTKTYSPESTHDYTQSKCWRIGFGRIRCKGTIISGRSTSS